MALDRRAASAAVVVVAMCVSVAPGPSAQQAEYTNNFKFNRGLMLPGTVWSDGEVSAPLDKLVVKGTVSDQSGALVAGANVEVKPVDGASWKLELAGLIGDKRPWTLRQIYDLPEQEIIVRHICVEGWDYIGQWSGVSLRHFLERIGADLTAR